MGCYNISHLLGKPQGPLLLCSVVGALVAVALLAPFLALVDVDGPVVVVVAAAWAPPFVSNAAAVPAPPSSHGNALATTP